MTDPSESPGGAGEPASAHPDDIAQPPPGARLTLRDGLPQVVTTERALEDAVAALAEGSGPLAVDAERASGYRYSQRAYLIQLRREGAGTVLIDPLPFGDVPNDLLAPITAAVGGAEWILHAASQDLPCMSQLGMRPIHLFDTELAGRLLNYPRVGLAVMVEELLGFSMLKEHSAVDWSRRPMPESWLVYAALDVEMLIELRDALADELEATGKAEWARQEFAAWIRMSPPAPRTDPWRRTSGIHRVRGRRALAIVREMWQVRDELGQARDIAPGRILRDAAIVEAAQAAPPTRPALAQLPGFSHRNRRYEREFAEAVQRALALPERDLPAVAPLQNGPPPARIWPSRFPPAAARLVACRERIVGLAMELDLPAENLLEPEAVRRLAWEPPDDPDRGQVAAALRAARAREWQVDLTAQPLAEALAPRA